MIAAALPSVSFVPNPMFSEPNAEELVAALRPAGGTDAGDFALDTSGNTTSGILPERLPAPLSRDEERYLFCRMNFLKHRLQQRQDGTAGNRSRTFRKECESLHREAAAIRNRIVACNLRLVAALAGRFATSHVSAQELFSEGCLPLLRAVELFDFSRGWCFSTYATHAVRHRMFRYLKMTAKRGRAHANCGPEVLEAVVDEGTHTASVVRAALSAKTCLSDLLQTLPEREQSIVSARWGLKEDEALTYEQIGRRLGLSKERVRVLAHRSIARLQQLVHEQRLEMPC